MKKINWDEAPENATHAGVSNSGGIYWYKSISDDGYEFKYEMSPVWRHNTGTPKHAPLIPKPEYSQLSEQQDGFPPEGVECEGKHNMTSNGWFKCVIIAYKGDKVWFEDHSNNEIRDFVYPIKHFSFRKIESERDRVKSAAVKCLDIDKARTISFEHGVDTILDGLYDAGMLVDPERKPMSRAEANNVLSRVFSTVPFSVSQRTELLDTLGFKD